MTLLGIIEMKKASTELLWGSPFGLKQKWLPL